MSLTAPTDELDSEVSDPASEKPGPAPIIPGPTRCVVLQKENGEFGMYLRDNMSITGCTPDSPANRAGITRGDEVGDLRVDLGDFTIKAFFGRF